MKLGYALPMIAAMSRPNCTKPDVVGLGKDELY
jgi:hypothetical protein